MHAFIYYISYPIIYLVSLLPFRVLYFISDGLYFLIYRLLAYRKKVVIANLRNSFQEKSGQEIEAICREFYRYFCDFILETIKTLTITPKSVKKHVKFSDTSIFKKFYEQGQSVVLVMGHYGNWELAGARFALEPYHQLYVIYHPLSNKYFEKLVYHMRTRLGNKLYAMNDALRGMIRDKGKITTTAFIADQTPAPKGAYWTTFLNQETPVFTGTAKIAKKLGYPIIYASVKRPKRGLYSIEIEILVEKPAEKDENEITEIHTKRLEKDIFANPEIWLWTHRRWKHKKPATLTDSN
ncbi:MAG: lysophospholipid acyltransferase family protein [Bacteroidetes bacterium]|nr:lysophospholipid acyltransferase family protein [Bacteroidota bacterium]